MIPLSRAASRLALLLLLGLVVGLIPINLPGAPPVKPAAADTTFTFDGGGFGHGLGMSQYGALGMAKAGFSAPQILGHYYAGTAVQALGTTDRIGDLRVRVAQRAATTLTPAGTLTWFLNGTRCAQSPPLEPVVIRSTGSGAFEVRGLNGTGPPACVGGSASTLVVDFGASTAAAGPPVRVSGTDCANGCRYAWGKIVARGAGSVLNLSVENLPMERYLRGLAEVPSSWPATALQAQAIGGRSYAQYQARHRRAPYNDPGYDLVATTMDQAYTGFEKEAGPSGSSWVASVDATAHQVSTHDGKVIQAFYSSSSGGHTENSEYVFVATVPYIRATPDPYDADPSNINRSWTRSYTGAELGSWTAARYGSIGNVVDVQISGNIGGSGRIDKATVRLVGTSGTRELTGNQFRSMINAYAGSGKTLLSTKLALRSNAPVGSLDSAARGPGGVRVSGWAVDPTTTAPIDVHVYVDGRGAAVLRADQHRPDVALHYPAHGANHGFSSTVPIAAGTHDVCVYAVGPTRSSLLSCRRIAVTVDPFGHLDRVSGTSGRVDVSGWAIDPDAAAPVEIHIYVDGKGAAVLRADRTRSDVASAHPGYGAAHGFSASVASSPGPHQVCTYAINVGAGGNSLLGCRTVDVVPSSPYGSLDGVSRTPGGLRVTGWAIDPNTADPIEVHVYVDGVGAGVQVANVSRPDVGNVYPAYGPNHGFAMNVPGDARPHQVCAYGINVGAGGNSLLGCRQI